MKEEEKGLNCWRAVEVEDRGIVEKIRVFNLIALVIF
jgi:hypothetical protein